MSSFSTCVKGIAFASAFGLICSAASAQSLSVNAEQAMAAIAAMQKYAKKDGSNPSYAVVDRDGKVVLLLAGNGAAPHNLGLARRKAFTANMFKMPTIAWRDKSMPGQPEANERSMPDVIPLGGGVPIMVGGEVIGAVGASGTRGGQTGDTACAQAGADAAAALVKRLQASN
jgi:glc operon protein GlcG